MPEENLGTITRLKHALFPVQKGTIVACVPYHFEKPPTPDEARELARKLIAAADTLDATPA